MSSGVFFRGPRGDESHFPKVLYLCLMCVCCCTFSFCILPILEGQHVVLKICLASTLNTRGGAVWPPTLVPSSAAKSLMINHSIRSVLITCWFSNFLILWSHTVSQTYLISITSFLASTLAWLVCVAFLSILNHAGAIYLLLLGVCYYWTFFLNLRALYSDPESSRSIKYRGASWVRVCE